MMDNAYTLLIKNNRTVKRILEGHKWIFSNELEQLPDLPSGSIVKIIDNNRNNFGLGLYNRNSLITVRLLNSEIFDKETICSRISQAFCLRKQLIANEESYRLVYSESDLLPGLIIDKFEKYFVVQILSAGMELFKDEIIESLHKIFPETQGILLRNNSYWRNIEGLNLIDEIGFGEISEVINISENGVYYDVSLLEGQKTGYFFDQRLNRKFISSVSKDKTVLDLFTNQGGFALNAAKGMAENAIGVDISESAIKMAVNNAKLNSFENCQFKTEDVFDYLKEQISNNKKYDIIICDPPAFAKNKKSVQNAIIAYKRINKLALKCMDEGIFFTSSCSQHIDEDTFYKIVQKSAIEANKELRLIYHGNQSPDHPIIPAMKETQYLKFFGFIVR